VTVRQAGQAIGGSPAALLAGSNELEKNFTLKEAGDAEGLSWVEAVPKSTESGFEKVRIGMAGKDMKAMELFDNFGQTTQIRLLRAERNPNLPAALFRFSAPAGADVIGE
jgi:outer membrane lipoprotein carrier protein